MTGRAIRRHQLERCKEKARRYVKRWALADRWRLWEDPRFIGIAAGVHCRPCSCLGCRNEKDVPPRRERAFMEGN